MTYVAPQIIRRGEEEDSELPEDIIALIHAASDEAVEKVIKANPLSPEGRSEWVWVLLPNGDLLLGTFPQGETFEAISNEATVLDD